MINIVDSERGKLIAINLTDTPFITKRIFIVDNVPANGIRGQHAHYRDHQILYCLSGSLAINRIYKSKYTDTIIIKSGEMCDIPPLTWTTIKFLKPNSSFLCLCSEEYDEQEYIRDYDTFVRIIDNVKI